MKHTLSFFKRHKVWTGVILFIAIVAVFMVTRGAPEVKREFVTAAFMTVSQEVDVTGRVVPAREVELSVETGGKVSSIPVRVGQKVSAGHVLLRVNADELQIKLGRQQAALEKAKIALAKQEPKTDAQDDLAKAYVDGFNAVADAFLDLPAILSGLSDVLHESYLSSNNVRSLYGDTAVALREQARKKYYDAKALNDDVLAEYRGVTRESQTQIIEELIENTYAAVQLVADAVKSGKNLVDYVEDKAGNSVPEGLDDDQESLDTYTDETNDHLAALIDISDTISDFRLGVTDDDYDIVGYELDIRQAELDIQDTLVQINKRTIKAPIHGTVSRIDVEVGESVGSGTAVVSVISADQFQIEVFLPEADLAKVVLGAQAEVTLDAYGSDDPFLATLVSLDPAETLVEGVATYKATLQFAEADSRILPGMTADIVIKGAQKAQVIAVPQRAVITRNGEKYVQVLEGETVKDVVVVTGLRGTDGNIEIVQGLQEGDKVIVFVEGR